MDDPKLKSILKLEAEGNQDQASAEMARYIQASKDLNKYGQIRQVMTAWENKATISGAQQIMRDDLVRRASFVSPDDAPAMMMRRKSSAASVRPSLGAAEDVFASQIGLEDDAWIPQLQELLQSRHPDEEVVFAMRVLMLMNQGEPQERLLVMTDRGLYNVLPDFLMFEERFVTFEVIEKIISDASAGEMLVKVPSDYDHLYRVGDKLARVVQEIREVHDAQLSKEGTAVALELEDFAASEECPTLSASLQTHLSSVSDNPADILAGIQSLEAQGKMEAAASEMAKWIEANKALNNYGQIREVMMEWKVKDTISGAQKIMRGEVERRASLTATSSDTAPAKMLRRKSSAKIVTPSSAPPAEGGVLESKIGLEEDVWGPQLQDLLQSRHPGEQVVFAMRVVMLKAEAEAQDRLLVMTDKGLYGMLPDFLMFEEHFICFEVMEKIVVDGAAGEMLISVPADGDAGKGALYRVGDRLSIVAEEIKKVHDDMLSKTTGNAVSLDVENFSPSDTAASLSALAKV